MSLLNINFKEIKIYNDLKTQVSVQDNLIYSGTLLKRAYELYSESIALISNDKIVTYKELYFRSIIVSKKLKLGGVKPHDRVLLYYENSLDFYILYFAIWQVGAVVVPVNIFLHEKELSYIITDSEPRVVIASESLLPKVKTVLSSVNIINPVVFSREIIDWATQVPSGKLDDIFKNFKTYSLNQDDLCVILYTSGTTGVPKGVMLTSKNIMTNVTQSYARFIIYGLTLNERFFCVLPLFHSFAQNTCMWLPIMIGAQIIVISKIDRKLILEGLKHKPTVFFGFPALYGLLCLMKTAPLDSVKLFVSGADMLPDKIRAAFGMVYGRKIAAGYGLTETSPVVALNHINQDNDTRCAGSPLVGIECDIRNDINESLPFGVTGTLWLKGDNISSGYYKSPDITKKFIHEGWLNTGDLAYFDYNGNIYISGRTKDIIIHKGFNIYPAEIENILLRHPAVIKAAVIGQVDDETGQIPVAFVAIKVHEKNLEESLRQLCLHNLAPYKIPKKFICLDDLPMNATGKVDKKQLHI